MQEKGRATLAGVRGHDTSEGAMAAYTTERIDGNNVNRRLREILLTYWDDARKSAHELAELHRAAGNVAAAATWRARALAAQAKLAEVDPAGEMPAPPWTVG